MLENRPGYSQTYQGVGLQIVKALSDRWLVRGTFSWNSWTQSVSPQGVFDPWNGPGGPNQNGGTVNGGPASAWVISASGLYQLPFGFSVSGAFSGRQGFPQQYLVRVIPHDTLGNQFFGAGLRPWAATASRTSTSSTFGSRKTVVIGPVSVTPSLNVFNAANGNTVLSRRGLTGIYNSARAVPFSPDARFNEISDFESPRIFQAAIQIAF